MLKVKFTAEGDKLSLVLDGHAGAADIGHDIVCAACSILAHTVAQIVKSETKEGSMQSNPVIELGNGKGVIWCEPKPEKYNDILNAYYVAAVGYTLLAHNYPQFVDLTVFGEPEEA